MEEKLLTAPEVAKILGVTSASVNRWCKAGDFPNAWRLNPSRPKSAWRIPHADVELFIKKRREQRGYFYVPIPPPDHTNDGNQGESKQLMLMSR